MNGDNLSGAFESKEDAGKPPRGTVARWIVELRLADERERMWRERARHAIKRYGGDIDIKTGKAASGFNILWSNTETLRPALYNSMPNPDVRRRFKDPDPIARYVSEVMERGLAFSLDDEDFDSKFPASVLDMLLAGRAVDRVRYVPSIAQTQGPGATEHDERAEEPAHSAQEGYGEEVVWERCPVDHVQWDDFRHGPGRCWDEVTWVAFKHRLTKDQCIEKFGAAMAEAMPLEEVELGEKLPDQLDPTVFKRATCWEIWDKDERRVIWINQNYPNSPLKEDDDPLRLVGFFPIPKPMYAVEQSDSLVPITLYSLYETQAKELDKITLRIEKIVGAIRARGGYASQLGDEFSNLLKGNDNELIPLDNAIAFAEKGGLDKFIWFTPVEQLVNVARELIAQREALKQTIYEITGLSDVLRGASNAQETATAQQLKSQWGTLRLQRMQRDVQRYIRDLMRLKAEVISEHFAPETLQLMTGVQLPTMAQKQQAVMAWQQAVMQAQQTGQQPPPQPDIPPAWEEVLQVMKDDALRSYRVDIETDSTIQNQLAEDQQAFAAGMDAIGRIMSVPMPFDVMKAILQSWAKRSRLSREVQDAIDKMPAPQPQPNPEQIKAEQEAQRMQFDMQIEQQKMTHEAQMEERRGAMEMQKLQAEMQIKQIDAQIKQIDLQIRQIEAQAEVQRTQMAQVAQAEQIEADREGRAFEAQARSAEQDFAREQYEQSLRAGDE